MLHKESITQLIWTVGVMIYFTSVAFGSIPRSYYDKEKNKRIEEASDSFMRSYFTRGILIILVFFL